MKARLPRYWMIGFGLVLMGCRATADGGGAVPGQDVPADLQVAFGAGGGFTGQWEGYTVRADGTVLRWEGAGVGDGARPAGRLRPEQVDSIWTRLQAERFFAWPAGEAGNATGFIEVVARADTHAVAWPVGLTAQGTAVHPAPLYAFLRGIAARAQQ
jgi:hypothetical protein